MKRRDSLFALLSASISGSPLLVDAQGLRPTRPFRIGLVPDFSPVWWESMLQIFTQGLAEQGHIEGRDYVLIRSGVFYGPNEQRAIARVLEGKPDLILATNLGYVVALRKATTTIPIVMWVSGFPVEGGVAESLTRPGGNVTGLTAYASGEVFNKLVHLLYEVKPSMARHGAALALSTSTAASPSPRRIGWPPCCDSAVIASSTATASIVDVPPPRCSTCRASCSAGSASARRALTSSATTARSAGWEKRRMSASSSLTSAASRGTAAGGACDA